MLEMSENETRNLPFTAEHPVNIEIDSEQISLVLYKAQTTKRYLRNQRIIFNDY